ncbi:TIGR04028 family ABC transporter substrate-binding protein [Georgenia satyanarayanai]|uniref:TIGR04028 family ABC transporter substrate-binding protein n=1 Tax=Georgenia satyanarayanai TaxID=860221 RepID=UPI00203E06BE|nr:TIGR04028 family ABC transporter substrate-binding protein [Georgenia satyanarayanai]MCM3660966.1 TIGR04028 family ABC transporter substrate-binding protein [Georgenia satyanarayanai]
MSISHRRTLAAATAAAATLVLAACSGSPGATSEAAADDGAPREGGTLTFLEYQFPTCFYAGGSGYYPVATVLNQIADKLTFQDPETREIHPWLAESWEVSEDATEYVFHLREDVTFSDGTPLTAEHVAANFDHLGLGDEELGLASQEFVSNYAGSEVRDEHTVAFTFDAPVPGFLQATSVVGAAIVGPATYELPYEEQCQLENVVATGPFTVTEVVPEQEYTLTAREDYDWAPPHQEHQGRAYLDEIHIVVTPEDSVRIGALTSGQADAVRSVQAYDEPTVEAAGYQLYAPQTNGVSPQIALRPDNPVLTELPVRQALLKATDTGAIVDTLFTDNYPVATSPLSSGATGYTDLSDKLTADPDEANRLLDEAGWKRGPDGIRVKDGQRLELTTIVGAVFPLGQETAELVAQQWEAVGAKLHIELPDPATAVQRQQDPVDVGVLISHVGRVDPDVLYSAFHSSQRDYLLSTDETLDGLLEEITSLPGTEERYAKAAEVQEYLLDNALTIPLYDMPQTYAAGPHVHGLGWEPVGRLRLYDTWLEEQ